MSGFNSRCGHLSRYMYVTSHSGKLSLAIPSWVGSASTSQRAVIVALRLGSKCRHGSCAAGKTVRSPCYTRAISERFRDKGLLSTLYFTNTTYWLSLVTVSEGSPGTLDTRCDDDSSCTANNSYCFQNLCKCRPRYFEKNSLCGLCLLHLHCCIAVAVKPFTSE